MGDAKVALPAAAITAGVAKGKVIFSWGQIRSWVTPPPTPTQAKETTELTLPLKVVAPAFLAHSKPGAARKSIAMDDSIPALFSGGDTSKPAAAPVSIPGPAVQPSSAAIPAPAVIPAPAPEPTAPDHRARARSAAPAAPASAALTISQMLGEPDKPQWSPQELVLAAIGLDGVSGAVIGLHEGLLVAAELPDHLKGDTIAAFLPQMFARLNNYTGEMKLGSVDELLFTTQDAHFQAYKLGEIYLAVLGKPGEALALGKSARHRRSIGTAKHQVILLLRLRTHGYHQPSHQGIAGQDRLLRSGQERQNHEPRTGPCECAGAEYGVERAR